MSVNKSNEDAAMLDQLEALTQSWSQRPSWDAYFMATALLMASRSSCERLNVGCVIVSGGLQKNRIVAAGYNGFLPGASHTSRIRDGHEQATVHAEQNAISDAARRGVSLEGATIYITHFPCINCAKILAAAESNALSITVIIETMIWSKISSPKRSSTGATLRSNRL